MTRDPRYDILFEPMQIGPVTAKNRFYQVPHCTGMGWVRPNMVAAMRGVKAEGGWGVVCTEYCSIHPSSDDLPHVSGSIWDERDIRANALMTDAVHEHGALAGVELWHGGARAANHYTRTPAVDVDSRPNLWGQPFQTRAMDKADIATLRRWHRDAALRARQAGFDIVYVYAAHGYLLANFLDHRTNTRNDAYGGSLENRTRLVREIIAETKEAVGDRCAVAVRLPVTEGVESDGAPKFGERQEMFSLLAEAPDLWDITVDSYGLEMGSSRFTKEAALEEHMAWVKQATSKPVVTVGRFTSPDTMASQLRRGVVDFIGAARPSIADPFLPRKIEEGRLDAIRECIGCNVCYAGDGLGVPIRCTQNPTMGEEWRKDWHPERLPAKGASARVLVVGAGPAGLEAARALGERGYDVMLAEATRELGGRVTREARLPTQGEYIRVRDYRVQALDWLSNVEVFRESRLTAEDVFAVEADHVALATGSSWRRDFFDGDAYRAIVDAGADAQLFTPDDLMAGARPEGPVVIYDADGYYMAAALAELAATDKTSSRLTSVTVATASDSLAVWAGRTAERWALRSRLMDLGVAVEVAHQLERFDGESVWLRCVYSGEERRLDASSLVLVGHRAPEDALYHALLDRGGGGGAEGLPFSLTRIGDCAAPSLIAAAVYAGHRYARELDAPDTGEAAAADVMRHDRVDFPALLDG